MYSDSTLNEANHTWLQDENNDFEYYIVMHTRFT